MIHDLSFPHDLSSVNSGISDDIATVQYQNIQSAIRHILKLGRGCFIAKTDKKPVFRLIPISP